MILRICECGTFFHKAFKCVSAQHISFKKEKEKRKMRKEISYTSIALLLILVASMFTVIPANAFIHPDGTTDNQSELFGPHIDQMQFLMYATQDAMWGKMNTGEIDLCDWPLTTSWRVTFAGNPAVTVVSAGGEAGMFLIDFNMDPYPFVPESIRAPYANPVYTNASGGYATGIPPISSNVGFRLACEDLFNRTLFNQVMGAAGFQILTPVPSYMGGYIWPAPDPAPAPNYVTAEARLNTEHIYQTSTGVRYWDYDGSGQTNNPPQTEIDACKLVMTYRIGSYRTEAGIQLSSELANMNFTFKYLAALTGGQNYQKVMLDKDYHITTLGWIYIGPDPDFLYDLYHVTSFFDDPANSCPNTADLNDTLLNGFAEGIKFAVTQPAAAAAALSFQQRFWAICAQIPLYSSARYGANAKYYTGGNNGAKTSPDDGENAYRLKDQSDPTSRREWLGFCNYAGIGSNTWFSYLNGYPNGTVYGDGQNMTLRYGWSEQGYPKHINPFYSEWYWDSMVLGAMYDSLGYRDPYDLSVWKGDLVSNWTVGTWTDPVTSISKSKVTVTLRPDVYWSDGTPMTIADVVFSLVESTPLLIAYGNSPPWWWPTAELVKSLSIIDAYTVEILYDVLSFFAEGWTLGGFYIIPKHIWKPLITSGIAMNIFAPDPNFVCSGPMRYLKYTPTSSLVLVANTVGKTITTDMVSHGASSGPGVGQVHAVTSTKGYHNYVPEGWSYSINGGTGVKVTPGITNTVTFNIYNKAWYQNETINGAYNIALPNGTVLTGSYYWPFVAKNTTGSSSATDSLSIASPVGKVTVTVTETVTITTNPTNYTYTTSSTIIIYATIPQDIYGSTFYDDIGLSSYAFKSELPTSDFTVDMKDVRGAAKGYGAGPGHPRWSIVADINGDHYIDMKDIRAIAKLFGWPY